MKALLLALTLIGFAANAGAQKTVKCKIKDLKSAQTCMDKVAKAYTSYQQPNDAYATENVAGLINVLKIVGVKDKDLGTVQAADYVGFMIEHGDEHHIYYFVMTKSEKGAEVIEILDLNTVDVPYFLDKNSPPEAFEAITYFLGISGQDFDFYSDFQDALENALE